MRLALPTTPRGRVLLAVSAIITLGLLYLLVSLYIVNTALVAERNEIEERPEDFGLRYEEVEFSPRGLAGAHPARLVDTRPGPEGRRHPRPRTGQHA